MELIPVLYVISYFIHIYAFVIGLICLKLGEKDFRRLDAPISYNFTNRQFRFTWSRAEKKYWTVNIGVSANLVFLVILPIYLYGSSYGFLDFWKELAFNYIHIATAIVAAMMHSITLEEIKTGALHGHVGKNL